MRSDESISEKNRNASPSPAQEARRLTDGTPNNCEGPATGTATLNDVAGSSIRVPCIVAPRATPAPAFTIVPLPNALTTDPSTGHTGDVCHAPSWVTHSTSGPVSIPASSRIQRSSHARAIPAARSPVVWFAARYGHTK